MVNDECNTSKIIELSKDNSNFQFLWTRRYRLNWNEISCCKDLTTDFIKTFKDMFNWRIMNRWNNIPEDMFEDLVKQHELTWGEISEYQYNMSEEFIRKHWNDLDKFWLEDNYTFSSSFMREMRDSCNLFEYIEKGYADKDFLEELKPLMVKKLKREHWLRLSTRDYPIHYYEVLRDYLDWSAISKIQTPLTAEFIEKFGSYLDWSTCLRYRYFKMKFIKKYREKFDWSWKDLCRYQRLSEDFIRKHENEIVWEELFWYTSVSEKLIEDMAPHYNEKCWHLISQNQRLTSDFVFKHLEDISLIGFSNNHKIHWNKKHALYALELIERKRTGL